MTKNTFERKKDIVEEIKRLKEEREAVILAHNYQRPEVQDVADYVGDSLELSQRAAKTDAKVIVFCGVHFMAESATILSPDKIVLLPEKFAGCPMADMVTAEALRAKKAEHPDATVVCYVNSSAEVKAESDICCTSANAVKVVESLENDKILFIPDRNLGHYVASKVKGKEIILWEGFCVTHERVTADDVQRARDAHPKALVVVHPECRPDVVAAADHVASTSGILRFARESDQEEFIIGTEMGVLHRLSQENPGKRFYTLSTGMVCPNMKMTTLDKVLIALRDMKWQIEVDAETRVKAQNALRKMLEI